jgi:hypothetical protein
MPLPAEINAIYLAESTQMQYNIMQYCCSATAHRMMKWGWEPEINSFGPRMLMLLAFYVPLHCRIPIILEAYAKAMECGDRTVATFIATSFNRPDMVPAPELAAV